MSKNWEELHDYSCDKYSFSTNLLCNYNSKDCVAFLLPYLCSSNVARRIWYHLGQNLQVLLLWFCYIARKVYQLWRNCSSDMWVRYSRVSDIRADLLTVFVFKMWPVRAFPLSDCSAGSHCGSMAMRRGIKDRKKKICSAGNIWPGSSCAAKINKSVKVLAKSVRGGSYY